MGGLKGSFLTSQQGDHLTTQTPCVCSKASFATFKLEAENQAEQEGGDHRAERLNWPGGCENK